MADVFVSYSRKDIAFVRRIHEALNERGFETWVDWDGIAPSEIWMARIRSAIEQAEAVVFDISPDAAASSVCAEELEHAIACKKRLVPVLFRDPDQPVRDEVA